MRSWDRRYIFKVMFYTCRVCGFRVRVWESHRTSRRFGYGYRSVTELTEVPGIVERAYRTHRSSGRGKTCCTSTLGIVARVVQNSQKFRVRVWNSYKTSRRSRYGYESLTELPEVKGIVARAYRTYRSSGQVWKCCTRTPGKVPGTGMNVLQNLQKFRVRVISR